MLSFISNSSHYNNVLSRVMHVKESLWIGTANIKDLTQFDEVWMGKHCKTCKRKDFCPDPILG